MHLIFSNGPTSTSWRRNIWAWTSIPIDVRARNASSSGSRRSRCKPTASTRQPLVGSHPVSLRSAPPPEGKRDFLLALFRSSADQGSDGPQTGARFFAARFVLKAVIAFADNLVQVSNHLLPNGALRTHQRLEDRFVTHLGQRLAQVGQA